MMSRKGVSFEGGSCTHLHPVTFVINKNLFQALDITMISYAPAHERCILCNDVTLRTKWPYGIQPILSAKDTKAKAFTVSEVFG